jgi:hypothetical protein
MNLRDYKCAPVKVWFSYFHSIKTQGNSIRAFAPSLLANHRTISYPGYCQSTHPVYDERFSTHRCSRHSQTPLGSTSGNERFPDLSGDNVVNNLSLGPIWYLDLVALGYRRITSSRGRSWLYQKEYRVRVSLNCPKSITLKWVIH